MGAAAYNRGSRAISAQIDREQPHLSMTLLRDWTAYSAANRGRVPLAATVVRFGDGAAWLMNRESDGWASFGYRYDSIWQIAHDWRLVFVAFGRDAHSRFVRVEPLQ